MRIRTAIAGALVLAAVAMAVLAFTTGDDDGDDPVAVTTTTTTQATGAQAGLAVWVAQGCASCHTLAAANAHGEFGPDLGTSLAGEPAVLDQAQHRRSERGRRGELRGRDDADRLRNADHRRRARSPGRVPPRGRELRATTREAGDVRARRAPAPPLVLELQADQDAHEQEHGDAEPGEPGVQCPAPRRSRSPAPARNASAARSRGLEPAPERRVQKSVPWSQRRTEVALAASHPDG